MHIEEIGPQIAAELALAFQKAIKAHPTGTDEERTKIGIQAMSELMERYRAGAHHFDRVVK
jgi:hypothetical protein